MLVSRPPFAISPTFLFTNLQPLDLSFSFLPRVQRMYKYTHNIIFRVQKSPFHHGMFNIVSCLPLRAWFDDRAKGAVDWSRRYSGCAFACDIRIQSYIQTGICAWALLRVAPSNSGSRFLCTSVRAQFLYMLKFVNSCLVEGTRFLRKREIGEEIEFFMIFRILNVCSAIRCLRYLLSFGDGSRDIISCDVSNMCLSCSNFFF